MNTHQNIFRSSLPWRVLGGLLLVTALFAVAFGNPTNTSAERSGAPVGLIFDISSSPNNAVAFQGLMRAEGELGIIESVYIPIEGDFETAIRQCATEGNVLCISVGFLSTEITGIVSQEYPEVAFANVDGFPAIESANLRYALFDHRQVGYLAGVVAGSMTTTNKLGVVAGMIEVPPVVDFSEGFRNAAQCLNPNADVWIEYTGRFDDPELGAFWAEKMITWGADVIFNVAGGTGAGAIRRAAELGAFAIGVDTDQYVTYFLHEGIPHNGLVLTSAMKNVDVAVFDTIADFVKGRFTAGIKLYDLSNNGVGIAPFHELSDEVPFPVFQLVNKTTDDINKGKIDLYRTCR